MTHTLSDKAYGRVTTVSLSLTELRIINIDLFIRSDY